MDHESPETQPMPAVLEQHPVRFLIVLNLYESIAETYDKLVDEGSPDEAEFFLQKYVAATGITPEERDAVRQELQPLLRTSV